MSSSSVVSQTDHSSRIICSPTLQDVLAYENDAVVARIAHETNQSYQVAEGVFRDTLRFLWLGHQCGTSICPSKRIDAGWHVFLIFTKDYRAFCDQFFGHFIDHHPRLLRTSRMVDKW